MNNYEELAAHHAQRAYWWRAAAAALTDEADRGWRNDACAKAEMLDRLAKQALADALTADADRSWQADDYPSWGHTW